MRRILLAAIVLLAGCSPAAVPAATPTPDLSAIRAAWNAGPHAHTWDLGKGPNTYCARCHSPRNWDPGAKIDSPPNCVSCKFATEDKPRIAKDNPLVAQIDWKDIGCEICHPTSNGTPGASIAWLDTTTGVYQPVSGPTELCEKCHADTDVLRHKRDLDNGVHAGYTCTRCHDAHSTQASCSAAGCHPAATPEAAATPIPGHGAAHANVDCVACHDASGLKAGPQPNGGRWTTFRTTSLLGRDTTTAYVSHDLALAVDCARCHYPNNPWGLRAGVSQP